MGKGSVPALLGFLAFLVLASPASAGRHCRYEGRIFNQGDLVCISLSGRTRLARCEMMLNNASWTFLQDGCPTAMLRPPSANGRRPRADCPLPVAPGEPIDNHAIVP